ncbi:MAG: hypothetical protein K2O39_02435, partial [Clostridiales bacterium]|nr:hypothetical protein [Clostridiales bacterium]
AEEPAQEPQLIQQASQQVEQQQATQQQQQVAQQPVQQVQPAASSKPLSGTESGYEWVDMGTSVKWATRNVGSNSSRDYGSYFAWGETKPAPNNNYSEENCRPRLSRVTGRF